MQPIFSRNAKACTGLTKPSPSTMPLMRFTERRNRHTQVFSGKSESCAMTSLDVWRNGTFLLYSYKAAF